MAPRWDAATVCAVVLAGGQGSRMGGVDKGLQTLHGQPLVWHALQRLRQQTSGAPGYLAVNANRNVNAYAQLGVPVWPDQQEGFPGPLAGFAAALAAAQDWPLLLTVPCDSPRYPLDLLQRLGDALHAHDAQLAVAWGPDSSDQTHNQGQGEGRSVELRSQPVFCLMRTEVLPSLQQFLATGRRRIEAWTSTLKTTAVPFDQPGDDPLAFANANTLPELQALERTPE